MNYKNRIGKIIKEKRKKEDLSIRDLSELTGLSTKTICEVEKENNIKHTFSTIAKIAKVLNLDLNYLADDINDFCDYDQDKNEIIIKRKAENIIELKGNTIETLVDFVQIMGCDFGKFIPNIGNTMCLYLNDYVSDSCDFFDLL